MPCGLAVETRDTSRTVDRYPQRFKAHADARACAELILAKRIGAGMGRLRVVDNRNARLAR